MRSRLLVKLVVHLRELGRAPLVAPARPIDDSSTAIIAFWSICMQLTWEILVRGMEPVIPIWEGTAHVAFWMVVHHRVLRGLILIIEPLYFPINFFWLAIQVIQVILVNLDCTADLRSGLQSFFYSKISTFECVILIYLWLKVLRSLGCTKLYFRIVHRLIFLDLTQIMSAFVEVKSILDFRISYRERWFRY